MFFIHLIKLADPKLLVPPSIVSNHHYKETSLKENNMRSLIRKSWILNSLPLLQEATDKQKNR